MRRVHAEGLHKYQPHDGGNQGSIAVIAGRAANCAERPTAASPLDAGRLAGRVRLAGRSVWPAGSAWLAGRSGWPDRPIQAGRPVRRPRPGAAAPDAGRPVAHGRQSVATGRRHPGAPGPRFAGPAWPVSPGGGSGWPVGPTGRTVRGSAGGESPALPGRLVVGRVTGLGAAASTSLPRRPQAAPLRSLKSGLSRLRRRCRRSRRCGGRSGAPDGAGRVADVRDRAPFFGFRERGRSSCRKLAAMIRPPPRGRSRTAAPGVRLWGECAMWAAPSCSRCARRVEPSTVDERPASDGCQPHSGTVH